MNELPISAVVCAVRSVDPARLSAPFFRYIDIASIDRTSKSIATSAEIRADSAPSRARLLVEEADVLVATVRPNLNAVAVVPAALAGSIASTGFCVLRPNRSLVVPRYLYYWTRSQPFVLEMSRLAEGAAYPAVSDAVVKSSTVPLPTVEEQRRIAAILDEADDIRGKRREALGLLDDLLRSTFLQMFGDPVFNPRRWPERKLSEIGTLDRGRSKHRPRNDPTLLGGAHPLIQTGDVARSGGIIKAHSQTYSDKGLAQSRKWPAGTLCITIAANIAETGILAFDACFPDSVVGFTPTDDVTIDYVQAWLGFLQPVIEARADQVAQKNINLEVLRDLMIPMPDGDSLSSFKAVVMEIRVQQQRQQDAINESENLFSSLLHRAFTGAL